MTGVKLDGQFKTGKRNRTLDEIIRVVCQVYDVSINDVKSKSRLRIFTEPKELYFRLAREYTTAPLRQIGVEVGHPSTSAHSTVISGDKNILGLIKTNKTVREKYERIKAVLDESF